MLLEPPHTHTPGISCTHSHQVSHAQQLVACVLAVLKGQRIATRHLGTSNRRHLHPSHSCAPSNFFLFFFLPSETERDCGKWLIAATLPWLGLAGRNPTLGVSSPWRSEEIWARAVGGVGGTPTALRCAALRHSEIQEGVKGGRKKAWWQWARCGMKGKLLDPCVW